MPSISIDYDDLLALIGTRVSREHLSESLLRLGVELKEIDEKNHGTIDVLANRPDLFSIEGIARAVKPFITPESAGFINYTTNKSNIILTVDKSVTSIRPYVVGAFVRHIKMNDYLIKSLMDIQEKLHMTVGRKRAKMSIGVHDPARLSPPFMYKAVDPTSLRFVPLGMDRELDMQQILEKHDKGLEYGFILNGKPKYPVIVDSKAQVLSFPPIINGTITTVTSNSENLFIDVTGTDYHAINIALNTLCTSLSDRGAGIETITIKPDGGNEFNTPDFSPKGRTIAPQYIQNVLGLKITEDQMISSLKLLRYDASPAKEMINILIPCYRSDILHEIDIVEDIAIGYGYEKVISALPKTHTFGKFRETEKYCEMLEILMVGHGFNETFTSVLANEHEQFEKMSLPISDRIEIMNPLTDKQTCVRVSMIPSLLTVLAENKHHELPQKLFEVGDVVFNNKNRKKLGIVVMHPKAGFTECKSLVESILRHVHDAHSVSPKAHASFIDGRCAAVIHNGNEIGYFGEIHPQVLDNFGLSYPVVAAELAVDELMK